MEKEKDFNECRFGAEVLNEAISAVQKILDKNDEELRILGLSVEHDDSTWRYDSIEEFIADYRKYDGRARLSIDSAALSMVVSYSHRVTSVSISSTNRINIEAVFDVFENNVKSSTLEPLPPPPKPAPISPVVFIGHGRSPAWRDLKDHLHEKHGISIEAYETGARAGHTIRDILEEMVGKSSFALLVLTNEDEQADGGFRARQNVIHEAGLFQGTLGFSRAILLLEDGVEEFTNVQGVQYIKFNKNNIKETYGEVLATLNREFPKNG